MYYPNKPNPARESPPNLIANPTQIEQTKRKRGGQKGNRNARKHGFYSATLSPAQTQEVWDITNLEGVDPEVALIRVKLQSCLQYDPGNRRVIREASRLLVKRYCERYEFGRPGRSYLKTVVDLVLEIASLRHSAGLNGAQRQIDSLPSLLEPALSLPKGQEGARGSYDRFAPTNGGPTKRIKRTLTTESARN